MADANEPYPRPFSAALLAPRYWPTWLGLGLFRLFRHLPLRLRQAVARRIGDRVYRTNTKRRQIVGLNLRWCFPELSDAAREKLSRDYFRALTQSFLDFSLLWWGGTKEIERKLVLEGVEHLQAARKDGRPTILLTCHTVGLDQGAVALMQHYPVVGLIKEARNPVIDWYMSHGRTRFDTVLYRREQGLRPVMKAIKSGRCFYYLPDEDLGPENSVFVPFFGVPTATITALPRLVRLTGAAVLPAYTRYEPETGRWIVTVDPPLEGYPSGNDMADAARMNAELERMIRQSPDQYMWSMRLFQTRPEGEQNPYR